MDRKMERFLRDLQKMIAEKGLEWDAPWKQVPVKYKKDFKSWVGEVMQQTWDGMWEKGWYNYHRKYLVFLIEQEIEKKFKGGKVNEKNGR